MTTVRMRIMNSSVELIRMESVAAPVTYDATRNIELVDLDVLSNV